MKIRSSLATAFGLGLLSALAVSASAIAQGRSDSNAEQPMPIVRLFADPLVSPRTAKAPATEIFLALPTSSEVGTRPCGSDSCLHLLDWDGKQAKLVTRKVHLAEWNDTERSVGRGIGDEPIYAKPKPGAAESAVALLDGPAEPALLNWD